MADVLLEFEPSKDDAEWDAAARASAIIAETCLQGTVHIVMFDGDRPVAVGGMTIEAAEGFAAVLQAEIEKAKAARVASGSRLN